jgi:hypothetical protein
VTSNDFMLCRASTEKRVDHYILFEGPVIDNESGGSYRLSELIITEICSNNA